MNLTSHHAREMVVAIWLRRPPEARMMKHTERFFTELERDEGAC